MSKEFVNNQFKYTAANEQLKPNAQYSHYRWRDPGSHALGLAAKRYVALKK